MFIPLLVVPLTLQLIAAADGVPKLDVTPSCRGAVQAGHVATTQEQMRTCIETEHRTRAELDKEWSSFPVSDRTFCLSSMHGFEPTYTELATCLEMKRDLTNAKGGGEVVPTRPLRRP